jgi:hypothetical protein
LEASVGALAGYDETGSAGGGQSADDLLAAMLGTGRALFSPADMAKAFPEYFPSLRAAERAVAAARADASPIGLEVETHERMWADGNRPSYVLYRPAGRGQQVRLSLCAKAELPAAQQKLETEIGKLAQFETDRFSHMTPRGDLIIVPGTGHVTLAKPAAIADETPALPEAIEATPQQPPMTEDGAVRADEAEKIPPSDGKPWYELLTVVRRIESSFGFEEEIPFPSLPRRHLPHRQDIHELADKLR